MVDFSFKTVYLVQAAGPTDLACLNLVGLGYFSTPEKALDVAKEAESGGNFASICPVRAIQVGSETFALLHKHPIDVDNLGEECTKVTSDQ